MPPKKIQVRIVNGTIEEKGEAKRGKSKPKEYNHPQWLVDYWLHRDRIIYSNIFTSEESKQDILKRYGK